MQHTRRADLVDGQVTEPQGTTPGEADAANAGLADVSSAATLDAAGAPSSCDLEQAQRASGSSAPAMALDAAILPVDMRRRYPSGARGAKFVAGSPLPSGERGWG